jgi:hypothetical protein
MRTVNSTRSINALSRPKIARVAALVVVTLAAGVAVAGVAIAAGNSAPLTRVSPPNGSYSLLLPSSWRFKDASYPSDHATHLWWLPSNALEKAEIVLSGCIGCITKNDDGHTPYPRGELPGNVISTYRISPWKLAYLAYAGDDPYPDNGVIVITRQDGHITGSFRIDLWLPQSQHHLATEILNSIRVPG